MFNLLDRAESPLGYHFLEASAGTGKTFSIEHAIIRLILNEQQLIPLENILIVTFTRAATRELKQRIYQNLQKIAADLQKRETNIDYLLEIFEGGEERLELATRQINGAIALFEDAQIFTIHGFCYQMLSRFAFEAGLDFEISDPDSTSYDTVFLRAVYDYLYASLSGSEFPVEQIEILLGSYRNDKELLIQGIAKLAKNGLEDGLSFAEIFAQFKKRTEEISAHQAIDKELFLEDFEKLSKCYKQMGQAHFRTQAEWLAKILSTGSCAESDFCKLLQDQPFFLSKMHENNRMVRAKWPPENLNYPLFWNDSCKAVLHLIERATDPLYIASAIASAFLKKWKSEPQHKSLFSPDDLLKKMRDSLENPLFLSRVKGLYLAVVIDEFQDTDKVQWELFTRLFLEGEPLRALYLVGDPKQSIYAFRKADLYTYLEAAAQIGEERRALLQTNYRSDKSLVEALNQLFSKEFAGDFLELPDRGSSIEYIPVLHAPNAKDTPLFDEKGGIHFLIGSASTGRERRFPTESMESDLFFPAIAREIINLEKSAALPLSSFAILVKDRYQAERLGKFLTECAIPFFIKQQRSLLASSALVGLIEVLEALISLDDENLLKRFLGGPFLKWSCEEIVNQERLAHGRELLFDLKSAFEKDGFGAFFALLLQSRFRQEGDSLLEEIVARREINLYEEMVQLAELLIKKEVDSRLTMRDYLAHIRQLKQEHIYYGNAFQVRSGIDSDAVQIMTTHMSKGLEFDIVFALGINGRQTTQEEILYLKNSERMAKRDLTDLECMAALREQDAEKSRQLYVACTRAKKRVYLPVAIQEEGKRELLHGQGSPVELFFMRVLSRSVLPTEEEVIQALSKLQEKSRVSFEKLLPSPHPIRVEVKLAETLIIPPKIRPLPQGKKTASFSSLAAEWAAPLHRKSLEQSSGVTIHTMPQGAETGVILHRIFEKLIGSGSFFNKDPQDRKCTVLEEIYSTHLAAWSDLIVALVEEIRSLPLKSDHAIFSLKGLKKEEIFYEMEFLFETRDRRLKGFIDLIFYIEGRYYILDWKSNWLGPTDEAYSEEKMNECLIENQYEMQAALYTSALQRYLATFSKEPFEKLFGGVFYCFLRGRKTIHFYPQLEVYGLSH